MFPRVNHHCSVSHFQYALAFVSGLQIRNSTFFLLNLFESHAVLFKFSSKNVHVVKHATTSSGILRSMKTLKFASHKKVIFYLYNK